MINFESDTPSSEDDNRDIDKDKKTFKKQADKAQQSDNSKNSVQPLAAEQQSQSTNRKVDLEKSVRYYLK